MMRDIFTLIRKEWKRSGFSTLGWAPELDQHADPS